MARFYQWDTAEQGWRLQDDPDAPGLSLEEISGGVFTQDGGAVRYTPTGRIVGNVALVRGSQVTVTDEGVVMLTNRGHPLEVNTAIGPAAQHVGEISGSLETPDGRRFQVDRDFVSLGKIGSVLFVPNEGPQGKADFYYVPVRSDGSLEQGAIQPGTRPATPDETTLRAKFGFILGNRIREARQLAAQGFQAPDGTTTSDPYKVAFWLAYELEITPGNLYDLSARVGL